MPQKFFFFFLVKSDRTFAVVHREKSLGSAFFKFGIDHLFDILESGKRNNCFGKKSGKSLEF